MAGNKAASGRTELRAALNASIGLIAAVAFLSMFVNVLMLTGPLYMLNLYDRVLGSRAVETLVALSLIVVFLYGMMGLLDLVRGRIMARVGARFQARLDRRVFSADAAGIGNAAYREARCERQSRPRVGSATPDVTRADVTVRPALHAAVLVRDLRVSSVDGLLATGGGGILIAFAVLNQTASRKPLEELNAATQQAEIVGLQIRGESDMVHALGMREAAFSRWQQARSRALSASVGTADTGGGWSAAIRTFRLFLQSAMLGLGAFLVLRGDMTAGAMVAASILLGRALSPIETIVTQWALFQRAREGWENLSTLLSEVPVESRRTALPKPKAHLEVEQITVIPPGESAAALRMISFQVQPGQAVGVVGNSGAGKSTLARAITGLCTPAAGKIRLGGAALNQYDPDVLGKYIGYLPQRVTLFDGTIKENIARLSPTPDDAAVVKAAQRAGAHEMILRLPEGYDTRVTAAGGRLSGGQVQRIGLARAMYGDPVLIVLDEPNSNLDNDGSIALNAAIRAMKEEERCILIMAHRPAAIQECDLVLLIDNGMRRAFGPKDEVLREILKNHQDVLKSSGAGGVT